MIIYCNKIKELREKHGFSQEYVADKLGLSRQVYSMIEKGSREPKISELQKLAELFEVNYECFFGEKENTLKEPKVVFEKENAKIKQTQSQIRISVPQRRIGKFKEVLLYILNKVGAKFNVGETVIYKLLYFIDFDFYEKYEEQLIGAVYIKNHHGPTPVEFKKIVEQMQNSNEISKVTNKYFTYDQKKYLPLREPDLKALTALEIKHIDEVLERLSNLNAKELSAISHKDVPWIIAEINQPIEYEAVFYRTSETSVRNYDA